MKLTKEEFEQQLQQLSFAAVEGGLTVFDMIGILEEHKLRIYGAHLETMKHMPGWTELQEKIKEIKGDKK